MNRNIILLSFIIFISLIQPLSAQQFIAGASFNQIDESEIFKTESFRFIWANIEKSESSAFCEVNCISPVGFTCFGIGVDPSVDLNYSDIYIEYKLENGKWNYTEADFSPNVVKRDNLYWTDINFTSDGMPAKNISIRVRLLGNTKLDTLKLQVINIDFQGEPKNNNNLKSSSKSTCPSYPTVIPRSVWLDPYYIQPTYIPEVITPHHVVIHHGASPDTYTDGAAVARSYWNYHVNTLGWNDIGYNYLTDKDGNIYKGRMNTDPLNQDCKGAHAGASNTESIGVNFLGNSDVTYPTTVQLDAVYQLLGWWFNDRGYDPTQSANITLQSGGTGSIPRICGHRDVKIGGTTCPGDALYAELPLMRSMTAQRIDDCNSVPSTDIQISGDWKTSDFFVDFQDVDSSGLGMYEKFWQVLDYDNNNWGANRNAGHLNDNFNTEIEDDWISQTGTWIISNSRLEQTDEVNGNTNMYISLKQTDTTAYLYHWQMQINGDGSNRRAGIHIFCDDASQSNRNNNYMVYYRVDQDEVQLYKYTDNTYSLESQNAAIINAGQWYDCKLYYNPSTGKLKAWLDNQLVSEWTDADPYTQAQYFSLRTGDADVLFEDVKVYTSRTNSETVSVGEFNDMVRYQNQNPTSEACRIKSIVLDEAMHFSPLDGEAVDIDWTVPEITGINDGSGADEDILYGLLDFPVNWTVPEDIHSGIASIEVALGTQAGESNVFAWTNVSGETNYLFTGLDLNHNTTYYSTIRVENNAGLITTISSDGAIVKAEAIPNFTFTETEICIGESVSFTNTSLYAESVSWEFQGGDPTTSNLNNVDVIWNSNGTYNVTLTAWYGENFVDITIPIIITLHENPIANFSANETTVYISNPTVGFINNSQNASDYYWDFGDGTTSIDSNPWHDYSEIGVYDVMLVSSNAWCESNTLLKEDYIIVEEYIYSEIENIIGMSIFPNPANDILNIVNEDFEIESLELTTIKGERKLYLEDDIISNNLITLDISEFASGAYIITIVYSEKGAFKRIHKKLQIIKD